MTFRIFHAGGHWIRSILIIGVGLVTTPASATTLDCVKETSGECTSSNGCVAHPPATFVTRIGLPATTRAGEIVMGSLQVCNGTECGQIWEVEARQDTTGNWQVTHLWTETYLIDTKSGFYSTASMLSGNRDGRIEYSFGRCTVR